MFAFLNQFNQVFSMVFVIACAAYFTVKWWLSERQLRHILAHRSVVPSPFDLQITLDQHQHAADYAVARLRLSRLNLMVSMVFLLFLTLGGGLEALATWVKTHMTSHPLHFGVVFIVLFSLINGVLDLPFSYYAQFKIQGQFGFNRMTLRLWLLDMLKSTILAFIVGVPLLYGVLAFISFAPTTWWLWAWCLFMGLNLSMMWLYPTVIAPLFNTFTPLEAGDLKSRLEHLLTRCGFKSNGMFVMDGSRRSAQGNAYFTGFGANKRIVFFDTLLKQLNAPQIEAVLAHELGHFHHKHILKRMAVMVPMSLAAFALLGYLSVQDWFYTGLGISSHVFLDLSTQPSHLIAMGLMMFSLVLPVFTFMFAPLASNGSRKHEFEADAYAVHNSSGENLIDALVCMYQENSSFISTDPLYSLFYDSHPPAAIRVAQIKTTINDQMKATS